MAVLVRILAFGGAASHGAVLLGLEIGASNKYGLVGNFTVFWFLSAFQFVCVCVCMCVC